MGSAKGATGVCMWPVLQQCIIKYYVVIRVVCLPQPLCGRYWGVRVACITATGDRD
jgi:hypothetical protein